MSADTSKPAPRVKSTATRFVLRGLAISLPPILTVVILIWIGQKIYEYMISPISTLVRYTISQFIDDARPTSQFVEWRALPPLDFVERRYRLTPDFKSRLETAIERPAGPDGWSDPSVQRRLREAVLAESEREHVWVPLGKSAVPYADYLEAAQLAGPSKLPQTPSDVYMELVTSRYFGSQFYLSAMAIVVIVVLLYFLGGFVTARIGAWAVHKIETEVLARVPLVSSVYGSVKQVTDMFLTDQTANYNRVIACEYPRRGLWSIGFVTSDSLAELAAVAGEPLVTVLMPTSPVPMGGFTIHVPRSEVIDLDMTLDQAFQFCLSCGVLIPPQQKPTPESMQREIARRLDLNAVHAAREASAPRLNDGHRTAGETSP